MTIGIVKFRETYKPRIWGGEKLRRILDKSIHEKEPVGEAWLIADHPECESVVAEGPSAGKTLRTLMEMDACGLLGAKARPTYNGRFPLLLKLIDAGDDLSVQVHPDDAQAEKFGENDRGKTEMWYMLDADPNSRLISGVSTGVTRDAFAEALNNGDPATLMRSYPVSKGDSVFVRAGGIHAIGAGVLLAEIQQNSDITYRLFDWNRVDANGAPRELHIDKALAVVDWKADHGGRVTPLRFTENGAVHEFLAACAYFAAKRIQLRGRADLSTDGSFHIVLALDEAMTITTADSGCVLQKGGAALVPAHVNSWRIQGAGSVLDYYVPDLIEDVIQPLRRHGYGDAQIRLLGGLSPENAIDAFLA